MEMIKQKYLEIVLSDILLLFTTDYTFDVVAKIGFDMK